MKAHEKKEKKKNITCVNVHETHLFVKLIPDFRTKWNVSFSCNKCVNNNNQNRASFFLVSIITFLFFFLLLLLSRVFPIRLTDASCFFWRKNIIIIPFIQFINMKLSFFSLSLSRSWSCLITQQLETSLDNLVSQSNKRKVINH